jgi:GTPase SAR1 family protein
MAASAAAPAQTGSSASRTPIPESPGAFRIGSLVDPTRKRYLKAIFYGPPGAGKTTLAASAADVEPLRDILLIAAEGGELVIEDNARIQEPEWIDVVRIKRIEQLQKLYSFLQNHCRARDRGDEEMMIRLQNAVFHGDLDPMGAPNNPELHEGDRLRQYHTVIIDSLTEIEAQNLAVTLKLDHDGLDVGDIQTAGWDEFRKNNHSIQRIVRAFRDLDLHILIICAQAYSQDELKRFHYQPALTGKLATQVQGFVDIVGWLNVGTDETGAQRRALAVQPHTGPKADAKNRFAAYKEPYFMDPSMTTIMEATGFLSRK